MLIQSPSDYLQIMGITQWRLRDVSSPQEYYQVVLKKDEIAIIAQASMDKTQRVNELAMFKKILSALGNLEADNIIAAVLNPQLMHYPSVVVLGKLTHIVDNQSIISIPGLAEMIAQPKLKVAAWKKLKLLKLP